MNEASTDMIIYMVVTFVGMVNGYLLRGWTHKNQVNFLNERNKTLMRTIESMRSKEAADRLRNRVWVREDSNE